MLFHPVAFSRLDKAERLREGSFRNLCEKIVISLGHLLDSRAGQSPACPQFGVVGGAHGLRALLCEMPRTLPDVAAVLQHAIIAGEPRLQNVKIFAPLECGSDDKTVSFSLKSSLVSPSGSKRVFEACIGLRATGHVIVKSVEGSA